MKQVMQISGTGGSGDVSQAELDAVADAQFIVAAADAELTAERVATDTATVAWDFGTAAQAKANVPNDAISNAKLANMDQATFKMRAAAAGTGDPIDGTAAQAKTALAIDHGADVSGLTDDDHTQYALLAGRATGQTITGGTAANDDLTLRPTSNATKGDVIIADTGGNVIIGGAATASRLRMLEPSGSGTNYTEFVTQAQGANITYTLPPDDGDSGEVLSTDGSGSLTWIAQSGGSGSVLEVQVFS